MRYSGSLARIGRGLRRESGPYRNDQYSEGRLKNDILENYLKWSKLKMSSSKILHLNLDNNSLFDK